MYPAFVRQLEADSGISIDYRTCGALEVAYEREHWIELQKRAEVQRRFGIAVDTICKSTVDTLAPGLELTGLSGALFYPRDACVAPLDLVQALRIACERGSVRIVENMAVQKIRAVGNRVLVDMGTYSVAAQSLVLSAGAWSSLVPITCAGATVNIPASVPIKGHLIAYSLPPNSLRPILRHRHHYIVQRKSGFTIAGSSAERCGFERTLNRVCIREIRSQVGSFYSPLRSAEPIREWMGFRPGVEEAGPVIRRVTGTSIWLAYGHYRNGILLTPATAHLLSAEILGQSHPSEGIRSACSCV